jgi:glycosyltransferase involved in cell wall biosynthesis
MTRLVDWDLIVRYTAHQDPVRVPTIGGRYRACGDDRISSTASYTRNRYLLRRKHQPRIDRDLRVLYIVWDYPQLTETYVRWEIACMRRWGVHVEVWSEIEKTAAPYASEVPVHHGSLEDAIRRVKPHVAHVHWLNIANRYHERIARAGLQMTVRGHGFEFDAGAVPRLLENPAVQAVYVFPHYAGAVGGSHPRVRSMTVAFNGDLYYPQADKDRFLVVRTASGKPAKAVESFIDIATLCPQHRFVLVLGVLNRLEHYVDEVVEYNRSNGSPVDIRINLPTESAAALVRQAGIFLHTYGNQEPFGMPISIAEAMATGAYTLVRRLPGAAEFVGDAGALYGSAEEAAQLIRQSARWYHEQWLERQARTVEFAYQNYPDVHVLRPLFHEWQRIVDSGIPAPSIIEDVFDPALRPALAFLLDEAKIGLVDIFGNSFLSHVVGTWRLLRNMNADVAVARAGLFHSIYIDNRVTPDALRRLRVRQVIGERSERLVYAFCAINGVHIERALDDAAPIELPDRFAIATLRLSRADFDDVCLIHLAEWTEKAPRCPEARLNPGFYRRIAEYLARSGRIPGEHPRATCNPASHPLRRAA